MYYPYSKNKGADQFSHRQNSGFLTMHGSFYIFDCSVLEKIDFSQMIWTVKFDFELDTACCRHPAAKVQYNDTPGNLKFSKTPLTKQVVVTGWWSRIICSNKQSILLRPQLPASVT